MTSTDSYPKYDPSIPEIAAGMKIGNTILIPTDCILEIACHAFNQQGYESIYNIKEKPKTRALILLVSDLDMLKDYVSDIHPRVETLLVYHKRPLTIVYKTPRNLPAFLLDKNGSVAIRIVKNELCKNIIKELGSPIAVSSANIHMQKRPSSLREVATEIIDQVKFIVTNDLPNSKNLQESVIAEFNDLGELTVLRD